MLFPVALAFGSVTGCKKYDTSLFPFLTFKDSTGFTASDAAVPKGDSVWVGVSATLHPGEKTLDSFKVFRHYDNGPDTLMYVEKISGAGQTNYKKNFHLYTRHVTGTEEYTFRIIDAYNASNERTLTLTTQ